LALTSPTGGGRSVGIVRSRTKATEFSLVYTRVEKTIVFLVNYLFYAAESFLRSWQILS
jgi:hypothetical protein